MTHEQVFCRGVFDGLEKAESLFTHLFMGADGSWDIQKFDVGHICDYYQKLAELLKVNGKRITDGL